MTKKGTQSMQTQYGENSNDKQTRKCIYTRDLRICIKITYKVNRNNNRNLLLNLNRY